MMSASCQEFYLYHVDKGLYLLKYLNGSILWLIFNPSKAVMCCLGGSAYKRTHVTEENIAVFDQLLDFSTFLLSAVS